MTNVTIKLRGPGQTLVREGGPGADIRWVLMADDERIRTLDAFESEFVECAYQAGIESAVRPAPLKPSGLAVLKTDCMACSHRRAVPGNAHIRCAYPDRAMTGDPHGVRNGWFLYPLLFDPVWRTKECAHFTQRHS